MKSTFLTVLLALIAITIYGQSNLNDTNFDFVIMIDNDLPTGGIARQNLEVKLNNDSVIKIPFRYHPGDFRISESDYEIIMNDRVKEIQLVFAYYKNGAINTTRRYAIEIKKSWFNSPYNVIRIYNVDKGPYKNLFAPLAKDKPYTFELFSPGNTFTRVRNR